MRRTAFERIIAFGEWLHPRREIVALLLLALSATACISFFGVQTGDSARYLRLANNISQGLGYSAGMSEPYYPEVFRPPFYPYFLAALTKLGIGIYGIIVIQIGLYFLAILLAEKIALVITKDRRVALSAILILAAYLPIIRWVVAITTESLCAVLFVSACLWFLYFVDAPTWKNTFALALFLTGLFLTRPTYFVLIPFVVLTAMLYHYRARQLKYTIVLIVLLGAATLPWGARNVMVLSGAFQPFGVGSGMALFVGAIEIQEPDIVKRDALIMNHPDFQMVHGGSDPIQMLKADQRLKQTALETIRARRRDYLKRIVFLTVLRQWIEAYDPRLPWWGLALAAAISSSLAILGHIGFFIASRDNLMALSLGGFCYAISASHAIFANEARYTAPVRPILYIFSSIAAAHFIGKFRRGKETGSQASLKGRENAEF